jgi:hypothetical protein
MEAANLYPLPFTLLWPTGYHQVILELITVTQKDKDKDKGRNWERRSAGATVI